ncbi:MAG TPA: amidohydrolase [Anaerolineae bacterium]|nr:amidohydrolase [Anaerolineae bacterium]
MDKGLLLLNGTIYTMDPSRPRVQAVAAKGSRIEALGTDDEMRGLATQGEWRIVDLRGRAVLPAFTDCHLHFLEYAVKASRLSLEEQLSLDEALSRVQDYVQHAEAGAWIRGSGWSDSTWPPGAVPWRQLLDRVAPAHPVVLTKKDGHVIWVNSEALRRAGVNEDTPEPPGGVMERDSETGEPTGILKEGAMHLVCDAIPSPSAEERQPALRRAVAEAHELGITGIHDCGSWQSVKDESLSDYQEMIGRDELAVRVFMMLSRANLDEAIKVGLRSGFGDSYLRVGNVKLFCDGTLGSQTAEMIEPFVGQPDNKGVAAIAQEELEDTVRKASSAGIACSVHAIGDKANRRVLDAFETQRRAGLGRELRHRIEHVQLLHADDVPRFKELQVIASMQPIHATQDMYLADRYWGERARLSYAWRSLVDSGARLAFGSDAPVESMNPLVGIHAAVTRQRTNGEPAEGWYPEQRLTVAEAVHGYTLGAAYACGTERDKGSIAVGKLADLIVLSHDIFEIPPADILSTHVVATVFDGRIVHGFEDL